MDWTAVYNQFKQTWLTTILSLILFSGVTYFLIWSEGQTIRGNLILEELVSAAESIDVHNGDEAERYEGRVVHIVGPLRVLEPISEPDYNIHVQAVKLRKRVQMYQWIEETTETENFLSEPAEESQKTYWYHKDWRDHVVESSLFYIRPGHHNPASMPMFSETHIADNVKIGWMHLGLDVKRKVNDYYEIWSDTRPDRSDIKLHSGFYYHGNSALEHEIGDLRIHFSYAGREDDIYTAVGVVERGVLQPYSLEKFPTADPLSLMRKGSYSLKQLYDVEKSVVNTHTWKYRMLGFVQVFASAMTLHPEWLTLLFFTVMQFHWISSNLRRCTRLWINLVLSFSYTMFIISIPWLFHKPTFGVMVLGGVVLPILHYSTLLSRDPPDSIRYTRWEDR
ncbi:transmembrane protein 43 homolog isoform X1 [Pararge aegeria]|uniref:transmembrane protein 43 homolog isoform X1 n=1 Tax=Pararge aegeria TaxID=116150 RepID=UPI0019D0015D|nr:transmembrane protein 43 homolog isoform X1 [Pararge aegeria]XP_039745036.1 transmembrane protein 43 homolog isoform X1 [Pararge aegeria]